MISSINEKFELPAELDKQLENTAYSALGYILTPHIEKFKKKLFANKALNDECYKQLKNVFSTIKKFAEGSGNNTKITFKDVLVPEYFSLTTAKEQIQKTNITIEKSGDDIWVNSKNNIFPNFYVSKDPAGWDLKRYNENWNTYKSSYEDMLNEFDNSLVLTNSLINKLIKWQSLDKPKKPKTEIDGQKMSLVYEKDGINRYDHYFRVLPSQKVETYPTPNYFQSLSIPIIVQTVYTDQFYPDTYSLDYFNKCVSDIISTTKHEGRHLLQRFGQLNKNLSGDYYGGPKKDVSYRSNVDVRGINPNGITEPTSKNIDPNDPAGRVLHPFRDVEFKTNLYTYKHDIEKMLSANYSRQNWKEAFKNLLLYTIGKIYNTQFRELFPYNTSWNYSTAKPHLETLYKNDRPKFNEMVRELYKLLF